MKGRERPAGANTCYIYQLFVIGGIQGGYQSFSSAAAVPGLVYRMVH